MFLELVGQYLFCIYFEVIGNFVIKGMFFVDGKVECIVLDEYYRQVELVVFDFQEILYIYKIDFLEVLDMNEVGKILQYF